MYSYCNQSFIEISGFSERELLGKPHSIVRHPDMPRTVFKFLWEQISRGKELNAFVKNLAKDGSYYWVFANVTPSLDINGKIIGYYSVRRKPNKDALSTVENLYKELKNIENKQGLDVSLNYLHEFFAKQSQTYFEAILRLQLGGKNA